METNMCSEMGVMERLITKLYMYNIVQVVKVVLYGRTGWWQPIAGTQSAGRLQTQQYQRNQQGPVSISEKTSFRKIS